MGVNRISGLVGDYREPPGAIKSAMARTLKKAAVFVSKENERPDEALGMLAKSFSKKPLALEAEYRGVSISAKSHFDDMIAQAMCVTGIGLKVADYELSSCDRSILQLRLWRDLNRRIDTMYNTGLVPEYFFECLSCASAGAVACYGDKDDRDSEQRLPKTNVALRNVIIASVLTMAVELEFHTGLPGCGCYATDPITASWLGCMCIASMNGLVDWENKTCRLTRENITPSEGLGKFLEWAGGYREHPGDVLVALWVSGSGMQFKVNNRMVDGSDPNKLPTLRLEKEPKNATEANVKEFTDRFTDVSDFHKLGGPVGEEIVRQVKQKQKPAYESSDTITDRLDFLLGRMMYYADEAEAYIDYVCKQEEIDKANFEFCRYHDPVALDIHEQYEGLFDRLVQAQCEPTWLRGQIVLSGHELIETKKAGSGGIECKAYKLALGNIAQALRMEIPEGWLDGMYQQLANGATNMMCETAEKFDKEANDTKEKLRRAERRIADLEKQKSNADTRAQDLRSREKEARKKVEELKREILSTQKSKESLETAKKLQAERDMAVNDLTKAKARLKEFNDSERAWQERSKKYQQAAEEGAKRYEALVLAYNEVMRRFSAQESIVAEYNRIRGLVTIPFECYVEALKGYNIVLVGGTECHAELKTYGLNMRMFGNQSGTATNGVGDADVICIMTVQVGHSSSYGWESAAKGYGVPVMYMQAHTAPDVVAELFARLNSQEFQDLRQKAINKTRKRKG